MHLAKGMDVNAREDGGGTALGMASVAGQVEAMRYLIEQGADVNAASNDGGVALHGAAFFGEVEAVELLLASGADPNVRNNDGFTPGERARARLSTESLKAAEGRPLKLRDGAWCFVCKEDDTVTSVCDLLKLPDAAKHEVSDSASVSELQGRVDGVAAMPHRLDALDVAA